MTGQSNFWKIRLQEWTALDPPGRISEGLFGLIMVLTFTCTLSVSNDGEQDVGELLWAALGCNLAWGLVDAIMHLMDEIVGRAHGIMTLNNIKRTKKNSESRKIIRENISPLISELMEDDEIDRLGEKVKSLPDLQVKRALTYKDFLVAGQIFLIVFLITFPVAMPFLFMKDVAIALRTSNGTAIILLFAGGFTLARYSGLRPVLTALAYTAIGVFLVVITMALGG
jgi:hypothetical protein